MIVPVRKRRLFGATIFWLATLGAVASNCGRERATSTSPPSFETTSAKATGSSVDDRAQAISTLLGEAKKRLSADRAVVNNQLGYEKAYQRHLRDKKGTRADVRIPAQPIDEPAVRKALEDHAASSGLLLVDLKLGSPLPADPPIPREHLGPGPYDYRPGQLWVSIPVTVKASPPDRTKLDKFFRGLPRAVGPMVDLRSVELGTKDATFEGHTYQEREIVPPTHVVGTPTLAELAARTKVTVPEGHARLADIEAVLAEHAKLLPGLREAMTWLGKMHLEGKRFQLFRQRAREIETRSFTELVQRGQEKK